MTRQIPRQLSHPEFCRLSSTDISQIGKNTDTEAPQRQKFCNRASRLTNQSFQSTSRNNERPTSRLQTQTRNASAIAQGKQKSGLFKVSNRILARLNLGLSVLYGLVGIGIGVLAAASLLTPFPFGLVIGAIIFLLAAQTIHAGVWYQFDKLAQKDQKIERHQKRLVQANITTDITQVMKVRNYYDELKQQYEHSLTISSESSEIPPQETPFAQSSGRKYYRPIAKPIAEPPLSTELKKNSLLLINWTRMPKNNYHSTLVSKLSQNAKPS